MKAEFTAEELEFQNEVKTFLNDAFPAEYREKVDANVRLSKDELVNWQKILFKKGWAAPSWPKEYGGTGWSQVQKYIFATEMGLIGAPEPIPFGMKMVAPIIMAYGTDEQKARFLPDILECNVWWCQGYSEPNSGSDLASLKTSAVRDGDHYIVNGAKTWNTYGQYADWIFCLVRTDTTAKKQEGISFLLIDMHSPGISLKPIVLIDGHPEVNEVFFDDVRVPVENLIGEENKGWTYAKVLLTHERTGISGVPRGKKRLSSLKRIASETDDGFGSSMMENDAFKNKIASLEIDLEAIEYAELRTLASVSAGKAPGPESSILKIVGTELAQRIEEAFVELAAYHCLPFVPDQFEDGFQGDYISPGNSASAALTYFNNRKATIYGGSNEIQRNIICKAVLGL